MAKRSCLQRPFSGLRAHVASIATRSVFFDAERLSGVLVRSKVRWPMENFRSFGPSEVSRVMTSLPW
jgi:hypothetical protein